MFSRNVLTPDFLPCQQEYLTITHVVLKGIEIFPDYVNIFLVLYTEIEPKFCHKVWHWKVGDLKGEVLFNETKLFFVSILALKRLATLTFHGGQVWQV